ncbi:ARM repeat superfamily protein isoform 2 [Hibiscus syriacus]|uniref:ARM repeat superfamily protein isoform 2 n=1 Tax=Hibiscus syriacus TaxID=106335 RepID=A0A6A2X9R4_HIBSY|nr:ARM repeat superfamily protein isoform 2 [Hibiscus syriacus]
MARISALLASLLLFTVMAVATSSVERENKSSSFGLFWSTAKEEGDPLHNTGQADDSAATADDIDGGFSTLEGMLQWAIGHSDPVKLKEKAQDVQRLSPLELRQRQLEIQELMEKLKMPSDAQLMQIALDDLQNLSLSLEDRHRALEELLILVEPIDNANGNIFSFVLAVAIFPLGCSSKEMWLTSLRFCFSDMCKLGGLGVIIRELDHSDSDVRKISAWILGKASQNNPYVQKQALELGALATLMKMVNSSSADEATKAFYAVSALIRNNMAGQQLFFAEAGDKMLQDILSSPSVDIRLRRKAVFLVGDLVECQLEKVDKTEMPFFSNRLFLKSVVDLTASSDLDLQEKALVAIKNLLQLKTTEAMVFEEFCRLGEALERIKKQLENLMLEDDHREYVTDVESLRKEVERAFQAKLENARAVPT